MPQKIRVISPPRGSDPPEIRQEWVGLVLPTLDPGDPYEASLPGLPRPRQGFAVALDAAMPILERDRPQAAAYWREYWSQVPANAGLRRFAFNPSSCEVVDS